MTVATFLNKAQRLERSQDLAGAAEVYGEILSRHPQNEKARAALESLRKRLKNIDEPPQELVEKITDQIAKGQISTAASACANYLNTYRKSHFLWQKLGQCHLLRGALNEAATCLNKAMELNSKAGETYALMASVYNKQGQTDNALALFRKALTLEPENLILLKEFGSLLLEIGHTEDALAYLRKASELAPQDAEILHTYASALQVTGQADDAQNMLERAIEQDGSLQSAHYNLGEMHVQNGHSEEALACLERAESLGSTSDQIKATRLHVMAQLNDWRWVDEYTSCRRFLGLQGTGCSPLALMAMEDNPDLLRIRTQAFAAEAIPQLKAPARVAPAARPSRLRIGYFSSDFHDHTATQMVQGLLAAHDRTRFEVFAYAYGPKATEGHAQIHALVDHYIDASTLSDRALIQRAQADGLDIAIDLKGFSGGNRCAIFGASLAPVQISYNGYPGTLGSEAFDYMIADWQVCPPGSERYFDEHLIRMPHSYQVSDRNRTASDQPLSRSECGLPDEGFVFCSFNSSYKITPQEFNIWMRLLGKVDDSVLWLLDTTETAKENLREAARARGIAPERLVFAPQLDPAEHLARLQLADLFLDTFVMNAQTTGSDALSCGLPVLTMAGKQFAARISTSLLTAVGLPELITQTPAAYERQALALAQNPDRLADIKTRLNANRMVSPLFDTQCFARDFEEGLDLAYRRWMNGQTPDHIDVATSSSGYTHMPNTAAIA